MGNFCPREIIRSSTGTFNPRESCEFLRLMKITKKCPAALTEDHSGGLLTRHPVRENATPAVATTTHTDVRCTRQGTTSKRASMEAFGVLKAGNCKTCMASRLRFPIKTVVPHRHSGILSTEWKLIPLRRIIKTWFFHLTYPSLSEGFLRLILISSCFPMPLFSVWKWKKRSFNHL